MIEARTNNYFNRFVPVITTLHTLLYIYIAGLCNLMRLLHFTDLIYSTPALTFSILHSDCISENYSLAFLLPSQFWYAYFVHFSLHFCFCCRSPHLLLYYHQRILMLNFFLLPVGKITLISIIACLLFSLGSVLSSLSLTWFAWIGCL